MALFPFKVKKKKKKEGKKKDQLLLQHAHTHSSFSALKSNPAFLCIHTSSLAYFYFHISFNPLIYFPSHLLFHISLSFAPPCLGTGPSLCLLLPPSLDNLPSKSPAVIPTPVASSSPFPTTLP